MGKKLFVASIFSFFLLSLGWAQQQEQGPKKPARREPPGQTEPQREQRQPSRERRPIFLYGTVILDDGSRPEEQVQVEMLCHGSVRRQTYAFDGRFSLEFGTRRPAEFMDASVSGPGLDDELFRGQGGGLGSLSASTSMFNTLDLTGCELRASLPGFRSDTIHLGRRRPLDDPDVGVIVLHRLGNFEGTIVSVNTLKAPKNAKKAFEKAQKELNKKKANHSKAAKELQKAVKLFPEFSAAWSLLGETRLALQDHNGARQAFEKAIAAEPKYISPYLSLAGLEFEQGRWGEVAQLSSGVIKLNPYVTHAHYLRGVANYYLGRLDLAEESVRNVQTSNKARHYPATHFILGAILARKGNIPSATSEFHRYLEVQSDGPLAEQSKQILAGWEKLGLIAKRQPSETPEN